MKSWILRWRALGAFPLFFHPSSCANQVWFLSSTSSTAHSIQSAKKTPRREEDNTRGTPQQPGPQMLTDGTDTGRQPGGPSTRSSEQNSKVLCMTHHITATGRISILPFQTTLRDETSAFRRSTMTRPPPRGSNTRLPIRFSSGFVIPGSDRHH